MKKKTNKNTESCFRYQFTKAIILCAVAVFALCLAGIILSVYRIWKNGVNGFNDFLKYPFIILICIFCIALVVSILIKSQYVVGSEKFIVQFGFIKSKYPIKDITSVILNTEHQKVTVYFGEDFLVLSLPEALNDKFIKALLAVNPDVEYSFTLSDAPDKDNEE